MTPIALTFLSLLVAGALCVSILRFWRESKLGATSVRRLAALSSALTLLVALMLYSGELRHNALLGLRQLGAGEGLFEVAREIVNHLDQFFTSIASAINGLIGAEEAGYRPDPPAWPAALLILGYALRFVIYRSHTRKGNAEAALTGAVYWSHITAFAMALAFLIVLGGANPWVLVPGSLVALAAIVVSVKLLIEDFGVGVRAAAETVLTEAARAAGWVAYLATEVAGFVRELLAYASRAYLERVRKPLRRRIAGLERRNRSTREATKKRLAEQDTRLGKRFGAPGDERD
jgi:hypothetical protein